MHKRADLMAKKLGYKVISMSYPGRHAFHTPDRTWPGRNVTAYDHHKYSLEVRTPIWLRGEHITRDQYDIIKIMASVHVMVFAHWPGQNPGPYFITEWLAGPWPLRRAVLRP